MEAFLASLARHWINYLIALPTAVIIPWIIKKVNSNKAKKKEKNEQIIQSFLKKEEAHEQAHKDINSALTLILRKELLNMCRYAIRKKHTDPEEQQVIIAMYEQYHLMTPKNGIIDHTYNKYLKLLLEEEDD